jgi:hypothetical protein
MIKANELRIGNFILFKQFGQGKGKIGQMKPGDFGRVAGDDPEDSEYHPIPLTPEWLERCGFEKEDGIHINNIFVREGLRLEDRGVYELINTIGINVYNTRIGHLHQRQNLYFALTGEELKIEL